MLEKLFKLRAHNTTVKTEIVAGLTTFLTMAYIIFVNPSILKDAQMDQGAVFVATCLAAAVGCFIMGVYANYPIAVAPGMGLNVFFTYTVVAQMGYSWQVALGAVFLSGVVFVLLSLFKIREWIINSIPTSLRIGIAAGIGLFLGFIALKNAGIVVPHQGTITGLGDIRSPEVILAALGFFLIIGLESKKVKGGVLISILVVTAISLIFGMNKFNGIVSMPPNPAAVFLQLDIRGAFDVSMISIIFAFLFVELFDTAGTLMAVCQRGNLLDANGNLPRLKKALLADSVATMLGALFGTSSITSYIESGAGVEEGGRTGLTAVVVAILFLLALFLSPLAGMIPAYATAGALFYICTLMISGLANVNWRDLTEAAPVAVTAIMMPLASSIADGIALGFITYTLVKVLGGRYKEISLSVWCLTVLFLVRFYFA